MACIGAFDGCAMTQLDGGIWYILPTMQCDYVLHTSYSLHTPPTTRHLKQGKLQLWEGG